MQKRGLIAVIAFNEEKNLPNVLESLKNFQSTYSKAHIDIVVIDNASTDDTLKVCKNHNIPTVSHCVNNGGSMGTVLSYFRCAYDGDYDFLVQFDGDGQHLCSELDALITPMLEGSADYVIGSRYLDLKSFTSTRLRRIGIRLFNYLIKAICGVKISDSTSGFRAYNKKVISFFAKKYHHEIIDPMQLLVLSAFAGARIIQVPIKMQARIHGVSEFTTWSSIRFVYRGIITLFACFIQKRGTF